MADPITKPSARVFTTRAEPSAAGRAATIDRLYRRHHAAVFRLALRYGLGNEAWAQDVVQDVFTTLLTKLPELDDHDCLDAWLYRVTTNDCLRKLRRDRMWTGQILRRLRVSWDPSEPSAEHQVFARHDLERTRVALAQLPARERVAWSMCLLDGKSQREVCETLGLSKGYVSRLISRANAQLEENLGD